jgi:hypothetical protein
VFTKYKGKGRGREVEKVAMNNAKHHRTKFPRCHSPRLVKNGKKPIREVFHG